MYERRHKSPDLPLFTKQTLDEQPHLARIYLQDYWQSRANLTRLHLEEMGVSRRSLQSYAQLLNETVCQDAYDQSEAFGTGNYENDEIKELVETVVFNLSKSIEPTFQERAKSLSNRFFLEQQRRSLFNYVQPENIPEACQIHGGIPTWTAREMKLMTEF